MQKYNILFFGSTSDSVIVLEKLFALHSTLYTLHFSCVVTQPPRPVGRKQIVTPTPVEIWAKEKQIPVLSFPSNPDKPNLYTDEQTVIDTLEPFKADLLISASYGQKIPMQSIRQAKYGGLNVHPSLLPRWRGADPVPWAILSGDHQTGVTVVTLSNKFDQGGIIAQKKIPITAHDTSDPLRAKLFEIGAQLLVEILASKGEALKGSPQKKSDSPYARRLTREDGFEPWEKIIDPKEAVRIDRKFRAFTPWPGLWTRVEEKRLKILACHLQDNLLIIDTVQLEGKQPVSFDQFIAAYVTQPDTPKKPLDRPAKTSYGRI